METAGTGEQPAASSAAPATPEARIASILSADPGYTGAPPPASDGRDEHGRFVPGREPAPREEPPQGAQDAPQEASAQYQPAAEEPAVEIADLPGLAAHLGVDVADLYNLRIPVTDPQGKRTEIALGEWKDAVQTREHLTARQKEIDAEKARVSELAQRAQEARQQEEAQVTALIQTLHQHLTAEFQGVNWEQLRYSNPAEYAALHADYARKQAQIQGVVEQAVRGLNARRQKEQEEYGKAREAALAREREALLKAVPDWRDNAKAESEMARLREYLVGTGFAPEEVNQFQDHRGVVMARKAMLYDELQKNATAAAKKVVRIGTKVLQPSQRPAAGEAKAEQARGLLARLKKSGSIEDAAAVIAHRRGK